MTIRQRYSEADFLAGVTASELRLLLDTPGVGEALRELFGPPDRAALLARKLAESVAPGEEKPTERERSLRVLTSIAARLLQEEAGGPHLKDEPTAFVAEMPAGPRSSRVSGVGQAARGPAPENGESRSVEDPGDGGPGHGDPDEPSYCHLAALVGAGRIEPGTLDPVQREILLDHVDRSESAHDGAREALLAAAVDTWLHLSDRTLALLYEGEVDTLAAEACVVHVHECADCRDRSEELAEMREDGLDLFPETRTTSAWCSIDIGDIDLREAAASIDFTVPGAAPGTWKGRIVLRPDGPDRLHCRIEESPAGVDWQAVALAFWGEDPLKAFVVELSPDRLEGVCRIGPDIRKGKLLLTAALPPLADLLPPAVGLAWLDGSLRPMVESSRGEGSRAAGSVPLARVLRFRLRSIGGRAVREDEPLLAVAAAAEEQEFYPLIWEVGDLGEVEVQPIGSGLYLENRTTETLLFRGSAEPLQPGDGRVVAQLEELGIGLSTLPEDVAAALSNRLSLK